MRHIKLVFYALDSSKHGCFCDLIPLISKGHHFPDCITGVSDGIPIANFSAAKMVPIANFEAVKCNQTVVKDKTEIIITNIVYRYKSVVGAPLHWPGKKSLKDIGGHYNECSNESRRTGEEQRKKGIFIEIF